MVIEEFESEKENREKKFDEKSDVKIKITQ